MEETRTGWLESLAAVLHSLVSILFSQNTTTSQYDAYKLGYPQFDPETMLQVCQS